MPFPFVYLCDLLNDLERPHITRYPMLPKDLETYTKDKVIRWLRLHRDRLNAFSTDSEAVMSMLQPEKQTDRKYGLDSGSLEPVIARALSLPRQHYLDLQRWRTEPLNGDLGACVKRVVENMENMATPGQANSVTVEEIDQSLLRIAAFNPRSSPAVQSLASTWKDPATIELLVNLYQRLKAREAKWLTRVILKDFTPIKFPENLEPGPQHSFLPTCVQLKVQFPSSAPPPVRRDGTRIIAGIGTNKPAILPPTPRRIAKQSSSAAPALVVAATETLPHPAAPSSSPQPANSAPEQRIFSPPQAISTPLSSIAAPAAASSVFQPTSALRPRTASTDQRIFSTPLSSVLTSSPLSQDISRCQSAGGPPSSVPAAKSAARGVAHTPSRTSLAPLSQNIPSPSPPKSPVRVRTSPSPSILTGGTGVCQYTSHNCPLSACIFILGPSVPRSAYIDKLLGLHGCKYTTSVRALSHPNLHRGCSRTCKRLRKVVLVESRKKESTVRFLERVREWRSTKEGKMHRIEVCDWRLLEYATKIDQGKKFSYDPWARCWIHSF